MNKKRIAIIALFVVALAGTALLVARRGMAATEPQAADGRTVTEVHLVQATRSTEPIQVTIPASLHSISRATLAARIPAAIVTLPLKEGQSFERGDILAKLQDNALRKAVEAAGSAAHAAKAEARRMAGLAAKGAATPREVESAEAERAAAIARLRHEEEQLGYAIIRAPFAGRVASVSANAGDIVVPGAPLIAIEGERGTEARAMIPASRLASVAPGSRLQLMVEGQPSPLPAVVTYLSQAADPFSHRFELKATVATDEPLLSGLFARLLVPGAPSPNVLVPKTALIQRGGLTGLFVAQGGEARLRFVAPGRARGDLREIRSGLSQGEQIVDSPTNLTDGAPIRPVNS